MSQSDGCWGQRSVADSAAAASATAHVSADGWPVRRWRRWRRWRSSGLKMVKGARKQMMNDWSGPWVTLSPPMGKTLNPVEHYFVPSAPPCSIIYIIYCIICIQGDAVSSQSRPAPVEFRHLTSPLLCSRSTNGWIDRSCSSPSGRACSSALTHGRCEALSRPVKPWRVKWHHRLPVLAHPWTDGGQPWAGHWLKPEPHPGDGLTGGWTGGWTGGLTGGWNGGWSGGLTDDLTAGLTGDLTGGLTGG